MIHAIRSVYRKIFPQLDVVILRLDAIGDFVLWLDSAQHLRKLYPGRHITLIGHTLWKDLADKCPYFDRVIYLNSPKNMTPKDKILTWIFLLRFRCQTLLCPVISRTTFIEIILFFFRAKETIAPQGDEQNLHYGLPKALIRWIKKFRHSWYTSIPIPPNSHELIANTAFINGLSTHTFPTSLPPSDWIIDPAYPLPFEGPYGVLALGASTSKKMWPLKNVATFLKSSAYKQWVIVGSGADHALSEHFINLFTGENPGYRCQNLCGKTSLTDLYALAHQAQWVVSNDTALSHIAIAVKTPSATFLGGGNWGRFHPYPDFLNTLNTPYFHSMPCFNCQWHCVFEEHQNPANTQPWPCVEKISFSSSNP